MRPYLIVIAVLLVAWAACYPLATAYNDDDSSANSVITLIGLAGFFMLPILIGGVVLVAVAAAVARLLDRRRSRR